MKTQIVKITPQMAVDMLGKNIKNRKLRESTVRIYARDMRNGQWQLTHQGIAFDDAGNLVDGQHRLQAIILANRPVEMMVTYGAQAHENIDTQIKRTVTDIWDIDKVKVATVKLLIEGRLAYTRNYNVASVNEIHDWYEDHKYAIDFTTEHLHTYKIGLRMASIKAAMAVAWYYEDEEKLKRFCEVFLSGEGSTPLDGTVLKFREWVIFNKKADANHLFPVYVKTQQAIKRFCEGKIVKSFNLHSLDPEYNFPWE